MSKDPAFLFYTQDWLTGTMFFNYEQKGKYITLLCAQHQLGGLINKDDFNSIVDNDIVLKNKFIETEDGFYNERLMNEMEKRSIKSTNLSANAKIRWAKYKQKQCKSNAIASKKKMPIEDENEDVNKDVINIKVVKEYFKFQGSPEFAQDFYDHFNAQDWLTGTGRLITNWRSKANQWIKKELNKSKEKKYGQAPRGTVNTDEIAAEIKKYS